MPEMTVWPQKTVLILVAVAFLVGLGAGCLVGCENPGPPSLDPMYLKGQWYSIGRLPESTAKCWVWRDGGGAFGGVACHG